MSREGSLALAVGALYLASRLIGLVTLPMFLDEATHIRWAVDIANGEKWLRPWNYGKGLSIFLNALVVPGVDGAYLWASRALTVVFGAVSLFAGWAGARRLFDRSAGAVFALLYVACPFALFYDRLALTDPPMAAFATLALLACLRLDDDPSATNILRLTSTMVLAVLTKATALLVGGIPVLALLVLGKLEARRLKAFACALLLAAAALAWPVHRFFATTATVRLGVGHRQADLLTRLATNLPQAASWLTTYLTWPIVLLVVAGLILGLRQAPRPALFLAGIGLVPVLAFSAVSTLWFPRYLVLVIVPLLLLAARGFVGLFGRLPRLAQAPVLLVLLIPALRIDRDVLLNPARAALPDVDREQFVLGWPSGYGTDGTLAFVHEELQHHPQGLTVIAHVHSRRTTWLTLGLEFARDARVDLRDLDLEKPQNIELLAAWAHARPSLLVVSPVGPTRSPPEPFAWAHLGGLVLRSCKPNGALCDEVYRLDAGRTRR